MSIKDFFKNIRINIEQQQKYNGININKVNTSYELKNYEQNDMF